MSDKYFYKLATIFFEWSLEERKRFLTQIMGDSNVRVANALGVQQEEQIEEWTGLTDLEGNPFIKKHKTNNVIPIERDYEDLSIFPVNTVDGDKITEKGFRRWVRREMKDYISALIENYEWKHGINDGLYDYVARKGWVDFVNNFNPFKFILTNTNKSKELSKEFEKQTGRSLKKEYMAAAKRLVNKKRKSQDSVSIMDKYKRLAYMKRTMNSLSKLREKKCL